MRLLARALAALLSLAAPAQAGDASAWESGHRSRVRLLDGGAIEGGARRLAGVEIRLDRGYKTYWRSPGEAGLPPTFDWSASRNVKAVEIAWPAPRRLEDPGGTSFGYLDGVVLPLTVTPERPGLPTTLALDLHFGVCKEICIPAQARLSLALSGGGTAHAPLLEAARARVPRPQGLGEGSLAILAAEAAPGGLKVRARPPTGAALFAEAPEGWYLAPPAGPDPEGVFTVEIAERPKDAAGPVPLTLTLVAGDRAIETAVSLDAGPPSR